MRKEIEWNPEGCFRALLRSSLSCSLLPSFSRRPTRSMNLSRRRCRHAKYAACPSPSSKAGRSSRPKGMVFANVELNVAAAPETIYQSGSVGKQFTATLAMMLVEEGKMSLDDHISRYVVAAPEIWKDITLRHLLTHTSGISNMLYDKIDMRQDYTEDDLVKKDRLPAARLPTGRKVELQQPRLPPARGPHSQGHGQVLRRPPAGKNLHAARHDYRAYH